MSEKVSLSELQRAIKDSLYLSLPDYYWVVAEIAELKVNSSGHCYLELVEKTSEDEVVKARVRAVIWNSRYNFLNSLFENLTGKNLTAGFKVLVKAKIEYHELYGLSLVINDIDPAFTAGDMALRKQQIINRLTEEGIIDMNKSISFPLYPRRVAVISSGEAAGYTDFFKHLRDNSYGYFFNLTLFSAALQGEETETTVVEALNAIADRQGQFDVVAIIRGGGSQTDLSWFDNYNISFHVAQFPLPVITGIGHEKDLSVTDIVAFKSLKTPTDAAAFLIEQTADTERGLASAALAVADAVRGSLETARMKTGNLKLRLQYAVSGLLQSHSSALEKFEAKIKLLDPQNTLRRGFSMTTRNGKIVKSINELSAGDDIETILYDGRIAGTVNSIVKS